MSRRLIIAGNWKMNGLGQDAHWAHRLSSLVDNTHENKDIVLCPPATLISRLAQNRPDWLALGGQDCSYEQAGAHTGDISARMLADAGCRYVIVGHSERRADHGESNVIIHAKTQAALDEGLTPIICIGETLDQRDAGQAVSVVVDQLLGSVPEVAAKDIVIAYEPVWAIGTGRTATPEDANAMHTAIRKAWPNTDRNALRILYGGSVKPANASDLMGQSEIDGALVGGASLAAEDFANIIQTLR